MAKTKRPEKQAVVQAQPGPVQIPLEYIVGDVEIQHASEMVVQTDGHMTTFCFFVSNPPLILGTPEQQAAAARKIKAIPTKCVARISIPSSKLAGFGQQPAPMNEVRMLPPHR